jgi:hypothetical protein
MLNVMAIGSLLASLFVPTALAAPADLVAPAAAPATGVTVQLVTVNGSGCPAGSVAVAQAPDNTAFTVTYSGYTAQTGPGISALELRKNCQLSLLISVPQGFTYAINSADYRGFAYLAKGASAVENANYYFQGSAATVSSPHTIVGPYNNDWQFTDTTATADLVFAPCGVDRNFNINTSLRVARGTSSASSSNFITMDSTDYSSTTIYHFSWKSC